MDGTMKWNGKSVKRLKPTEVTHTFTVYQYPESNQPEFFLNVPLPVSYTHLTLPTNREV